MQIENSDMRKLLMQSFYIKVIPRKCQIFEIFRSKKKSFDAIQDKYRKAV